MELTARPVKQVAKVNPKAKAKAKAQTDKMKDALPSHPGNECGGTHGHKPWRNSTCVVMFWSETNGLEQ